MGFSSGISPEYGLDTAQARGKAVWDRPLCYGEYDNRTELARTMILRGSAKDAYASFLFSFPPGGRRLGWGESEAEMMGTKSQTLFAQFLAVCRRSK